MTHEKNLYEEALHRTEEERHGDDFYIDALLRTIGLLQPFGDVGKAVHLWIIMKIYGWEAGLEVLQAMRDTPALACVPPTSLATASTVSTTPILASRLPSSPVSNSLFSFRT
ncbi:hypothetical protein DFH94DRAFT_692674 [Russula ochroleuca]|uniref:Histone deacetylase interacting domain-containing protein n=1 Tax=Russula ochroleuca TaxID=152965 RepID=A0A9P5MWK1_9AGAM|nr:hypothetical protein DFH94DRAFT_692674 [Russula ochroleuca]